MKKVLTRATLEEILDGAGLDPEEVVYNWPSGMYGGYGGHRSFAMRLTDEQLARFFLTLGKMMMREVYECWPLSVDDREDMRSFLPSGTDSLGKGTVTYFRGWELEQEYDDE